MYTLVSQLINCMNMYLESQIYQFSIPNIFNQYAEGHLFLPSKSKATDYCNPVTLKATVTKVIKEKTYKGQNEKVLKNTSAILVDPAGSINAKF